MRTLVTGGAGFLGSHICDYLLGKGHYVICMDNLLTGNTENINHLLGNPNFKFVKHNVSEYIYVGDKIDNVLHFASPASPLDYLRLPIQTLKVGSLGTLNAIGVAKIKKARFLLASTSEVYGDPLVHPQKEDYWGNVNPVGPRGVYDEAKRFAEAMVMAYHQSHGIDTRIVRIFNTYGPRMRISDGRALPAFISQAIKGEDLTVFGDGTQTRSFCYVSDLVKGVYKVLTSDISDPINLGNPTELRVIDIAKEIVNLTESKVGIVYKPLPTDDPKCRQPDITKARELLGWEPEVERIDGLKKTIEYFRKILEK